MKKLHAIFKHSTSNIFYTHIQVDGVRKSFRLGTTMKEAKETLKVLEKKIARGEIVISSCETTLIKKPDGAKDIRIEELAHLHLECVLAKQAKGTYDVRKHFITRFVKWAEGAMVSQITLPYLMKYEQWLLKSGIRCSQDMRHIRTFLRWGEDNEICTLSINRFPPVKINRSNAKPLKLTDTLVKSLFEKSPPDLLRHIKFQLLSGLRPKEFTELRWSDIMKTEGMYWLKVEHHKSEKSTRTHHNRSVPIEGLMLQILESERKAHPDSEFVFLNGLGKPYTSRYFRQRLNRWGAKVGIKNLTTYDFRHWFGTECSRTTNGSIVRQIMGHTNIATTDKYVHPLEAAHKEAFRRIQGRIESFAS